MLDTLSTTVHDRLVAITRQIVQDHEHGRPDRLSVSLREAGLTSLDLVKLVLAVEREFGVTIEPDDMDPENFETLGSLERLVARLSA